VTAVCHRCGGEKPDGLSPCEACGFHPRGPERAVAWLFSDAHLDPEELREAGLRIQAGGRPDPSRALLRVAERALGQASPAEQEAGPRLSAREATLLLMGDLVLTPFIGLAVWFGLRERRPRAARDALLLTVPIAVISALIGLGAWTLRAFTFTP
jgi:hypothetical protein